MITRGRAYCTAITLFHAMALLMLMITTSTHANLIQDGGFEVGITSGSNTFQYVETGNPIGAWTVIGTNSPPGVPVLGTPFDGGSIPAFEGLEVVHIGDSLADGHVGGNAVHRRIGQFARTNQNDAALWRGPIRRRLPGRSAPVGDGREFC